MGLEINFHKVGARFEEMSKKMQRDTLDEILDEGNKPLIQEMIINSPKDTEELAKNIGEIKKQGSGLARKSIIGINSDDRSIIERAYYNEHGTTNIVGTKWMKRSFNNSKSEVNEIVKNAIVRKLGL